MRNRTIACLLLGTTAATQLLLLLYPGYLLSSYLTAFRPLMYGLMLIFCLVLTRKDERTYTFHSEILMIASVGALVYLNLMFISGFFLGFAKNPMATGQLKGFVSNTYAYLGVALIREYLRSKIMTLISGKRRFVVIMFIVTPLVFTYCGIDNIKNIITYDAAQMLDYVFTILLPMLVLNTFLCYTARRGGMMGNMIFQLVYWAVYLYSPTMPDIPKIMEAIFIHVLVLIMFVILDSQEWKYRQVEKKQPVKNSRQWLWMTPAGIVLAFCLLFGLGAFPFIPVAVASNSMKDVFAKGDMVIIDKITEEAAANIQEGDIIQYRYGKISVVHRVVAVYSTTSGAKEYVTKGDNNPVEDIFPVKASQVIGFARWHIPYIGYPALLIASLTATPSHAGDIQTPD
ncbi:MAG: signal peptidase I [Peptococcaceae bacterium]|nr:signal peptidase I [Peptococcaceae bacterium]